MCGHHLKFRGEAPSHHGTDAIVDVDHKMFALDLEVQQQIGFFDKFLFRFPFLLDSDEFGFGQIPRPSRNP
jgi:hypothetical protein